MHLGHNPVARCPEACDFCSIVRFRLCFFVRAEELIRMNFSPGLLSIQPDSGGSYTERLGAQFRKAKGILRSRITVTQDSYSHSPKLQNQFANDRSGGGDPETTPCQQIPSECFHVCGCHHEDQCCSALNKSFTFAIKFPGNIMKYTFLVMLSDNHCDDEDGDNLSYWYHPQTHRRVDLFAVKIIIPILSGNDHDHRCKILGVNITIMFRLHHARDQACQHSFGYCGENQSSWSHYRRLYVLQFTLSTSYP